MNVILLAEVSAASVIGGAERVLREQALGLQKRGHHVSAVVREPAGDPRAKVSIDGLWEYRYPVSRRSGPSFVLSSLLRSTRAFDEVRAPDRPDAVVIHQSMAGLGPLLSRRCAADGWVYVCHSLAHEEYLSRTAPAATSLGRARRALNVAARLWSERFVLRRCARVVVLSEFTKRRVLSAHGIPDRMLRIIPGGADPVRFHVPHDPAETRRRLKLPLDKVILVAVRNLVPRMGLDNLVGAMALLGDEVRDLLLLIGGEGPLRPSLERLIHDRDLTDRVRLLGFVADEELPAYYQAADLVLMPTLELEGFGLVTVEALACGTPVLGTPVGAIPEVLARVDPRLIAEGTDSASLARAIRGLLRRFRDQPGEQERLSAKGCAVVADDYNWDRHNERLEGVLREACAGRGAPAQAEGR